MRAVKRTTDTYEGEGTLEVGGQSYSAAYWVEVLQEFHGTRSGAEIPGVVDLEGHVTLIGENAPNSLDSGEAVLTLDDGRRIGIAFLDLFNMRRCFPFKLSNAMDLGKRA